MLHKNCSVNITWTVTDLHVGESTESRLHIGQIGLSGTDGSDTDSVPTELTQGTKTVLFPDRPDPNEEGEPLYLHAGWQRGALDDDPGVYTGSGTLTISFP
jgi:hypothetical protein